LVGVAFLLALQLWFHNKKYRECEVVVRFEHLLTNSKPSDPYLSATGPQLIHHDSGNFSQAVKRMSEER
jgi:hypothetical protein